MQTKSMKSSKRISQTVIYAALILGSLIMVFPFVWASGAYAL
jgi:multiple sugar transport system permease protein